MKLNLTFHTLIAMLLVMCGFFLCTKVQLGGKYTIKVAFSNLRSQSFHFVNNESHCDSFTELRTSLPITCKICFPKSYFWDGLTYNFKNMRPKIYVNKIVEYEFCFIWLQEKRADCITIIFTLWHCTQNCICIAIQI